MTYQASGEKMVPFIGFIIFFFLTIINIRKNNIPRFQIDLFWRIYALYPQSVKRSFDKMGQTLKNWKVVRSQFSPKGGSVGDAGTSTSIDFGFSTKKKANCLNRKQSFVFFNHMDNDEIYLTQIHMDSNKPVVGIFVSTYF